MADATRDLKIVIGEEHSQAEAGLNSFGGTLKNIGEIAAGLGLERVTEQIINMGKALVTDSVKAYEESQDAVTQLDAVLKSTKASFADTTEVVAAHAVTVGISQKEHDKLTKQLEAANYQLKIQQDTWDEAKKHTQAATDRLQHTKDKVAELNTELNKTTTVMIGGGGVTEAMQITRDAALDLSKSLEATTTFSDEAVLSVENLLLTFTNIHKDTFPQATKAVLDMAIALKEDTKDAAIQLGKALQDPILGITALRRVGVNFNDDQKEVIKTLVKSGETLKAQQMILKELDTEFGGSAAAAATTFKGRMEQLKNTVDDLKEIFGKFIVDAITPFAMKLEPITQAVIKLTEGKKNWRDVTKVLHKELGDLGDAISTIVSNLVGNFEPILIRLRDMYIAHKDLLDALAKFIDGTLVVSFVALSDTVKFLTDRLLDQINKWLDWIEKGKQVVQALDAITNHFKPLKDAIKDVYDWINNLLSKFDEFSRKFGGIPGSIAKTAINGLLPAGMPGFAEGTNYAPGGLALVGERGPELVNLPQGSQVIPSNTTSKMLGGISLTINYPQFNNGTDIKDLVYEIKRALGRENELARQGAI